MSQRQSTLAVEGFARYSDHATILLRRNSNAGNDTTTTTRWRRPTERLTISADRQHLPIGARCRRPGVRHGTQCRIAGLDNQSVRIARNEVAI